jgi:hypothetical protein
MSLQDYMQPIVRSRASSYRYLYFIDSKAVGCPFRSLDRDKVDAVVHQESARLFLVGVGDMLSVVPSEILELAAIHVSSQAQALVDTNARLEAGQGSGGASRECNGKERAGEIHLENIRLQRSGDCGDQALL